LKTKEEKLTNELDLAMVFTDHHMIEDAGMVLWRTRVAPTA
jgi:hypothetical protein